MQLTKRQWVMFSFFIVNFAYILLSAALTSDFNVIFANLSILIFLAALYLERGYASRYYVLLASVFLIVDYMIGMAFGGRILYFFDFLVSNLIELSLYVAVGFFGYAYYHQQFKRNKYWITIILLSIPSLIYTLINASTMLSLFIQILPPLTLIQIILSIIYNLTLPAVMIIYTLIRKKEIIY